MLEQQTMVNWLQKRAHLTPNRLAAIYKDKELTFKELLDRSTKVASKMRTAGIKEGDHVALLLDNGIQSLEIIHAVMRLGGTIVFLNTRLSTEELQWQIEDSKATFFIHEDHYDKKVNTIAVHSVLSFSMLYALSEKEVSFSEEIDLKRPHSIIYTSGTTGRPKGVILTYENHWWSAIGSCLNLGLSHEDRWLAAVPFFHVSGLSIIMRSVIYGMTIVIHHQFEPKAVNDSIEKDRVTIVSVVSAMLSRMLDELEVSTYPKTLRCMLLGGGSAPEPLLNRCKEKQIPVFQTYGMTETGSQIVTLSPEDMLRKLGSAGKPLFPAQLKIMKDSQELLPLQEGEIVVKGPNVTNGYYNREYATAESIKNDWLYTGDIGYIDEEGFLYVLDRRSDLIISGGENVYPAEIESVLLEHESVREAGVTRLEDQDWGHVPVAFVVLKQGMNPTESELIQFCMAKLAKYKIPKSISFVEELPRNASNKIVRHRLLELKEKDV